MTEILGLEGRPWLRPKPPAYIECPEYTMTGGRFVADLCADANFAPDAQQLLALDAMFGRNDDDELVVRHGVIVGPRQSTGKTGLMKQCALGWLFVDKVPLVIYSAHRSEAASEMRDQMEALILGCRTLARETVGITLDDTGATLLTIWGSRMLFRTRTPGGGRSLSAPRLILDEAYAVKAAHVGALMPTIAAMADPQILTGSSHPKAESDWLRDVQDQGRAGSDPGMFYLEYKSPEPSVACLEEDRCTHARTEVGCGCDNPTMIALANPQYGDRSRPETFRTLRTSMTPAEYCREIMGWRDEAGGGPKALNTAIWERQTDADSEITGTLGLGAAIAPDRSASAIAICGRREDGQLHVEIVEYQAGASWTVERIAQLAKQYAAVGVAIAPGAREKISEDDLAAVGIHADKKRPRKCELVLVGSREYAQSCAAVVDDLDAERVVHRGQAQLTQAAITAEKRPLAGAWAWGMGYGPKAADVTPMEAVTLARYAFVHREATMLPAPFVIVSGGLGRKGQSDD